MALLYDEHGYVVPVAFEFPETPFISGYPEDEDTPSSRIVHQCHDRAITAYLGDDEETEKEEEQDDKEATELEQQRIAVHCIMRNQDDDKLLTVVKLLWCRLQVFLVAAPIDSFISYLHTKLPTVCIFVHPVKSPLRDRLVEVESLALDALQICTTDYIEWDSPMNVQTIFSDVEVADLHAPLVSRLYLYLRDTDSDTTLLKWLCLMSNGTYVLTVKYLLVSTGPASRPLDSLCKIQLPYLVHLAFGLDIEHLNEDCLCLKDQGSCKITHLLSIPTLTFLQLTVYTYDGCSSSCPPAIHEWAQKPDNGSAYTVRVMKYYIAGIADLIITFTRTTAEY